MRRREVDLQPKVQLQERPRQFPDRVSVQKVNVDLSLEVCAADGAEGRVPLGHGAKVRPLAVGVARVEVRVQGHGGQMFKGRQI